VRDGTVITNGSAGFIQPLAVQGEIADGGVYGERMEQM